MICRANEPRNSQRSTDFAAHSRIHMHRLSFSIFVIAIATSLQVTGDTEPCVLGTMAQKDGRIQY